MHFDDHAPDTGGDRDKHAETMYGEWRSGRPDGGIRFPEDPELEVVGGAAGPRGQGAEDSAEVDAGTEGSDPRSRRISRDHHDQA